ncbi:hypothetical protein ACFQE8_20800 [Salinirubellus sp. GCM10025818]|uniref:hypothetical protein n=1 Tax=Salinirubellus TaxID=2162630 RepID=UPI0030D1D1EB
MIAAWARPPGTQGDWPKEVGDHRVTTDREYADCGASDDRFEGFWKDDCRG